MAYSATIASVLRKGYLGLQSRTMVHHMKIIIYLTKAEKFHRILLADSSMLTGIGIAFVGHVASIKNDFFSTTILLFGPIRRQFAVTIDPYIPHTTHKTRENSIRITQRCGNLKRSRVIKIVKMVY